MTRPNILVFMTDDHAQWAAGCYGNREIVSPTMDHLARRGARFDHAFTPSPVCSPARASFFTGRIPSRHGIHDYLQAQGETARLHPALDGQTTLGPRLQQSGYETALVGKWHCTEPWSPQPGFDVWFSSKKGTFATFGEQVFYEGDQEVTWHGHPSLPVTDRAVRFLNERDPQKPFFLFVGYVDTHTPHNSQPQRLLDLYADATFEDIPDEQENPVHGKFRLYQAPKDAPDIRRAMLADYYASVTTIDEQMGRILDELDNLGLTDDTLVIYTADHGHMNGHHGLWCKGNSTIPQNLLDESIHVPLLAKWPGRIAEGRTMEQPVDHCDLFATVLDAAGVDWRAACEETVGPGRSWLPMVTDEPLDDPWRDLQFCEYANARMARTATAKLIRRYPGPNGDFPDEFYDLAHDPRENINAIDDPAHASTLATLSEAIDAYFATYEDPDVAGPRIAELPRPNPREPWYANQNG